MKHDLLFCALNAFMAWYCAPSRIGLFFSGFMSGAALVMALREYEKSLESKDADGKEGGNG